MQMRTSKTRNPLGSILRKRVSKQGQPIVVFDVRRRIRQEDGTYRDVTKRCYSRQEAILALAAMCLAGPHPPPYGHGHTSNGTRSITYKSYESAKDRCNNPNAISYKYYGERGIEFRFESFQAFWQRSVSDQARNTHWTAIPITTDTTNLATYDGQRGNSRPPIRTVKAKRRLASPVSSLSVPSTAAGELPVRSSPADRPARLSCTRGP
jgi:hypothetical protein